MLYFKLQAGCLFVLIYIIVVYIKGTRTRKVSCNRYFDALLWISPWEIVFDGATAWTVNHLDIVPGWLNSLLHLLFFLSVNSIIAVAFMYMHEITVGVQKGMRYKLICHIPFVISTIIIIAFMGQLEYIEGTITNYSMGVSPIACFVSIFIHFGMIMVLVIRKRRTLEKHKRVALYSSLIIVFFVLVMQIIFPEVLLSSLMPLLLVVAIYTNFEDPALVDLQTQNEHMVECFATIVENRDDSTGGHIKRTSGYVRILMKAMSKSSKYRNVISKDYTRNVVNAAPMHDIGKVSTPDQILQKPGKLTAEEYEIMKKHAENGADIILDTFADFDDPEFMKIAYEVARHHHEKWNGKGYPDGLKGEEIPLHARVMAIADVFDAVSQKRCYRDAMPIEECFDIIKNGSGTDFDPELVDLFMNSRDKIEEFLNPSK